MISLTPSLLAHQQSAARSPYLRAIARDTRFGIARFRWQRLYDGPEADAPHAATVAADGSLLRLRNDAGTLRLSRVATPGDQSDFSQWSSLGSAAPGTGVALAAHSDGEVLALYVTGSPPRTLRYRRSTDNGQSWAAAVTLLTEATNIDWLAAATRGSNGDACVFYTQAPNILKRLRRTAGAWAGSGTTWTNGTGIASLTGVAATHDGADYPLALTGTLTDGTKRAWVSRLVDNGPLINAWGSLVTLDEADPAATVAFRHPAIAISPELDPHAWYAAIETGPVAATRTFHVHPPHLSPGVAYPRWSFPEPHEARSDYGLALARHGTQTWATTPDGVWRATHPSQLDLSSRVLEATVSLDLYAATGRLSLDNADGALTPPAPPLAVGAELQLAPGYRSGAGATPEFGTTLHLEIIAIEQARHGRVELQLAGPWELMARRRAPQTLQVDAGAQTRAITAETLAARAGVLLSAGGGPAWTTNKPGMALPPGSSAAALRRLLEVAQEVLVPSAAALRVRAPGTTTDYAYGATAHPVKWFTRAYHPPRANWARAQGPDRYTEAARYDSIYAHGGTVAIVTTADATTDEKAGDYAAGALDKAARALTGTLCVPVNAGAELYDLVTVDDALTATAGQPFRVLAIRLDYSRAPTKPPVYQHVITLGEP